MDSFVRLVRATSMLCGILAVAALLAAVVVVCQMVVMRYFLGASTVWQTEFVTFAIVAATFIGAPYVLLHKGHVNVDLVPFYIPHRARLVLALFASGVSLVFCLVLAWYSWVYFHEAWTGGWTTETVWALPLWIPLLPLPIGMALLALQYVADILCLATGRDAPFGMRAEEAE
ncbi:C4-dicarboxylate ABC transporter substrate-binding protein [Sulfurifustis variabilis]|uniref:TRAP transporter small permease protein n=1 Tax=Sulfurifustis variabilis TaxID=1675686 RepID=A0A1B4V3P5_9GAMM|nr:C4-dicarboxylate ABC transporter substrate-binding protein [Sulfurifustis variabilis]